MQGVTLKFYNPGVEHTEGMVIGTNSCDVAAKSGEAYKIK